ncbi:MAG TPA: hypothetical protein PK340_05565 [Bacilli bacterium]|nr:hypothetical protein [Bacilli bacterium]
MEKLTFVLDVGSGSTKLIAGYVLDQKPIVVEAFSASVPHQLEDGRLVNLDISTTIATKLIAQMEKSVGQKILEVVLTIPPHGLQIFEATKTTNIISQQAIIANMDIKNLHNLFRKEKIGDQYVQIGIVPEIFELDDNVQFETAPIGEVSNNITLTANIHFGDRQIYQDYTDLAKRIDVKIRRLVVDVHGLGELLSLYPDTPDEYLLIDFGSALTSISFIAQGRIFGTTHFDMGARQLTDQIATMLDLPFEDALKLQEQFGYDSRENYYDGIVYPTIHDPEVKVKITQSMLNRSIESYFDAWMKELRRYIASPPQEMAAEVDFAKLPWVFIGGGRRLKGFIDLYQNYGGHADYRIPKIDVIGARSPIYASALGALLVAEKYSLINEENLIPVTNVERVKTNKRKPSYSAYEDEL